MYNDIKLEKGLYNLSGKSFAAALEELDPSAAYSGTPLEGLDAYERQLKRFGIRIIGADCDTVEKFFVTTESAVLFPEFIARSIKKGFDSSVLGGICAVKTKCGCGQYIGCTLDDSAEYTTTAETGTLPAAVVKESASATVLAKYGRIINASYEAVRQQRLDVFGIMLRSIGVKLANSVTEKALEVLAANATGLTTTSLAYSDLAGLYGEFDCFNMTTLIASPAVSSEIAAMSQLSDISADENGCFVLPFGAELVKSPAVGNDKLIGIDKAFALEFITSSDLIMETDKLIDRQLDRISVSITCGFRKITPDAVKVLTVTKE